MKQNIFIEQLTKSKKQVTIFLMTGIKLTGEIIASDENVIIITSAKSDAQMIYKHAISTIMQKKACLFKQKHA